MAFTPLTIGTQKGAPTVAFSPILPPASKPAPKLVMGHIENPTGPTLPEAVGKILPGQAFGKALGTSLNGLYQTGKKLVQGDIKGSQDAARQGAADVNAQFGPAVGDVIESAAVPASLAVSAPISLTAKIARGAGLGGTIAGAHTAAKGGNANEIAKNAAIGGAISGAIPLAGAGLRQLGRLFGAVGDKIQNTVIKPSQADIKDGFNIETVKKYNLGGSLKKSFEKTDTLIDDLSQQLNTKLADANTSLNVSHVYENTAKRLLGTKLESFGSNTSVEKALEQLRGEISAISGTNGLVSVPEAQLIKRASGHFGAWTYGVPTPEATAQQKVYNAFYNEMKVAIENASPEGVKAINKQISDLIPVMNALIRRIPVAERNSALSLTDIITMSAATLEPRALALTLANLASKSGTVGAALSRAGGKIAQTSATGAENLARTAITSQLGSSSQQPPAETPVPQSGSFNRYTPEQEAALRKVLDDVKKIDPTGMVGAVSKVGIKATMGAADVMKDALLTALSKLHQVPKTGAKLNFDPKLADETKQFITFLKETKNPTLEEMNRGLELVRLQGGNAKAIADEVIKQAQAQFDQLRDTIGRFTKPK